MIVVLTYKRTTRVYGLGPDSSKKACRDSLPELSNLGMFETLIVPVMSAVDAHKQRLAAIQHQHGPPMGGLGVDLAVESAKILTTTVTGIVTPEYQKVVAGITTLSEQINALADAQKHFAMLFQPRLTDEFYGLVIAGGVAAARVVFTELIQPMHSDLLNGLQMLSELQ